MTLKQNSNRGFTIVELLIVVVIIAILAAITIVAYNGIQARAKTSAAAAAAETAQKKSEAANALVNAYPAALTDWGANPDSSLAGSNITFVAGPLTAAPSSPSSLTYRKCTTPASGAPAQQAEIGYWNYSASTPAPSYVYLGGSTASGCTTWGSYLSGTPS